MKSSIHIKEPKPEVYPRAMINTMKDTIVLFHAEKKGTVIYLSRHERYGVGEYRTDWIMSTFLPFTGSVTIEAEEGE